MECWAPSIQGKGLESVWGKTFTQYTMYLLVQHKVDSEAVSYVAHLPNLIWVFYHNGSFHQTILIWENKMFLFPEHLSEPAK